MAGWGMFMLFSGKLPFNTRFMLVFVALAIAVLAHHFGLDAAVSHGARAMGPFGAFFVGAFYTLGITTPTAFIILIEMMLENDFLAIALAASAAAASVDTALFMLLKEQLERSAAGVMKSVHERFGRRNALFSLAGLVMFGSPVPDEFALAFMQISEIRPARIFIVVFIAKLIALLSVYAAVSGFILVF